jgi:hypothetical protein
VDEFFDPPAGHFVIGRTVEHSSQLSALSRRGHRRFAGRTLPPLKNSTDSGAVGLRGRDWWRVREIDGFWREMAGNRHGGTQARTDGRRDCGVTVIDAFTEIGVASADFGVLGFHIE